MVHHIKVKDGYGTLADLGVTVQYFPCFRNRDRAPHTVSEVLLSVILRGRGLHILDGQEFPEQAPAVTVTHYGQSHTIVPAAQGMEIMNILLDLGRHALPRLSPDLSRVVPLFLPLHPKFQNRLNRVTRIAFDNEQTLRQLVFQLYDEIRAKAPGYAIAVHDLLRLFLVACCRQVMNAGYTPLVSVDNPSTHRLEAVREYMDRHFACPLSLDALARRCGLSKSYFAHAFKRHTGKTPMGYRLEKQIQAALLALRNTDQKIAAIALDCGFNDLSYFNRSFKKTIGQTPMQVRRRSGG